MAKRGITKEERSRVRELIKVAKRGETVAVPASHMAYEEQQSMRLQALKQLRAMYDEWAEIARTVVKRRDYLIRLGLAKRKSPKKSKSTVLAPGGGE